MAIHSSWRIHIDTWQNQYNIVKLKNKIKLKKMIKRKKKKQRRYFVNKGHQVKVMVFPVVMYGCESLTVKKAER